jgi:hypothetical protein
MNPSDTISSCGEAHFNLHGEYDFADEIIAIPSDCKFSKTASKSSQNLRDQKSLIVLYGQ